MRSITVLSVGIVLGTGWGFARAAQWDSSDDQAYPSESVIAGSVCGNNVIEAGEECDGTNAGSCALGCRQDCQCGIIGPDIVVSSISGVFSWRSEDINGTGDWIAAFSVGTTSCNIGDVRALWNRNTRDHPVIRQNMYRLKAARFEQIGTSWVKHGFFAVNAESVMLCGMTCSREVGGEVLYPGCSDPYVAGLNGTRTHLGPASEINVFTGVFPYPPTISTASGECGIANRLQVHHTDIDPALNSGAKYFAEGHYVSRDEAMAGNGFNNVSHRTGLEFVHVDDDPNDPCGPSGGQNPSSCTSPITGQQVFTHYCAELVASTNRPQEPAIRAWKRSDPTVRETDAQVPGEGMFILAAKVSTLPTGLWRYEYALFNMNSDRSGGSFSVKIPENSAVQNIGFHDVDYHSGDPWDNVDWVVTGGTPASNHVTWSVASGSNNALRWSTLYNFRFDINVQPTEGKLTLGLFKPGQPLSFDITTDVPALTFLDCNDNEIADHCDIACGGPTCVKGMCGLFDDCNNNGVPDDPLCEADCPAQNGMSNGIPDTCDIRDCVIPPGCDPLRNCPPETLWCADCNRNTVPDGCEPDCDGNGVPDNCEPSPDFDGDGVANCDDLCPHTTPPNGCAPRLFVNCFNNGQCIYNYNRNLCLFEGGVAMCGPDELPCEFQEPCRDTQCNQGCLLGDYDRDGDIDVWDLSVLLSLCYTGEIGTPIYFDPGDECLFIFDFDNDDDIDLKDFAAFAESMAGP